MTPLRLTLAVLAVSASPLLALGSDPRYAKCNICSCTYATWGAPLQNFESNLPNATDASCLDWCNKTRPSECTWRAMGTGGCYKQCGSDIYGIDYCNKFTTESECHGRVPESAENHKCPNSIQTATRSLTCLDKVTCSCSYGIQYNNFVFDKLVDMEICNKQCKITPALNISTGCGNNGDCQSQCAGGCQDLGSCYFRTFKNGGGCCEGYGLCDCPLANVQIGWRYN